MIASDAMHTYFDGLKKESLRCVSLAKVARSKGFDPADDVEIKLAENMAERVEGLISVLAPQIVNSGIVPRIIELEKLYGALDWRVALKIAEEVARQKFCTFENQLKAIDIGIRTGFAYVTVGVVSSPLDGIVSIELKNRIDGKGNYLSISYAGPIRNAGGTAAAVSAIIADYVRKKMGIGVYDCQEIEIKRTLIELQDYHERVANLQYYPSEKEIDFLLKNMPVEVAGEPSEELEVSNYKDLPRVPTNKIRSGYCLMYSGCIPQKAPKLWKQLGKWGKEFDLEHWKFMEQFLAIQKKMKAVGEKKETSSAKISPDFTYIADLVAGRPVLGHPLQKGGWRLRYGRSRASGLSGQSIHPASMHVLDNYIATGTQLKVERPGKGAAFTPCDTIDGPIVKMKDGSVLRLNDEALAKRTRHDVAEILFLGDVLVPYGDFVNRAHPLVPVGYCEEWWQKDVEKAIVNATGTLDVARAAELSHIPVTRMQALLHDPMQVKPTFAEAASLAQSLAVPLHPFFTFHWADIEPGQFSLLCEWLAGGTWTLEQDGCKIVVPTREEPKRALEFLGLPHLLVNKEFVVIEGDIAAALAHTLGATRADDARRGCVLVSESPQESVLVLVNKLSKCLVRDKSGTYIGSRMGRPEKAKMREMKGSPHGLIPVGEEGGRLRAVHDAAEKGEVESDFPLRWCPTCNHDCIYRRCDTCHTPTTQKYWSRQSMKEMPEGTPEAQTHRRRKVDMRRIFVNALKHLGMTTFPDSIKGVRGMISRSHIPEHMTKAILRAKHDVHVNKDGTVRYDCSEVALTHFRPVEIHTSVERLLSLGYAHDIHGAPLERSDQVLELKCQDVVIPCCIEAIPHEPSDAVFHRVAAFVDDELQTLYKVPPFYNLEKQSDLVGHLIIGLAPHTSAGMLGRIIGFSKTQGFLAHPYFHSACRRDCDGDEIGFMLLMDALLNFSKDFLPSSRGGTMDAPLVLTNVLAPSEVDDMAFDVDIATHYPLELYEAAQQYKMPWDVKVRQIKDVLGTEGQYEGMGFTHDTSNVNAGVTCSSYKTLPSMEEKLKGQMALAFKIRAVNTDDVARLVIEKHFIKDTRGNLRKFSSQEFRCVACNEKHRRPPLIGRCIACGGKLLFTISEGSVIKYLEPTVSLATNYNLSPYLRKTVELLQKNVESVFGRDKDRQEGLGKWFG